MKNALLNLETYAITPNAALAQVSVAYFDEETNEFGKSVVFNIDPNTELKSGYFIDDNTVEWWLKQPEEIQKKLEVEQRNIKYVVTQLSNFLDKDTILWCNKQFEANILLNAFKVEETYFPVSFSNIRDIDTLTSLVNIENYKKVHSAEIDIPNKVGRIISALQKLKGIK